MKIRELIEELQKYSSDMEIMYSSDSGLPDYEIKRIYEEYDTRTKKRYIRLK